jgi:hypothetical protein
MDDTISADQTEKDIRGYIVGENFDYCNNVGGFVSPLSPNQGGSLPPRLEKARGIPEHGSINALDFEIAEKQLQLLQWKRALERQEPGGNWSAYSPSEMNDSSG